MKETVYSNTQKAVMKKYIDYLRLYEVKTVEVRTCRAQTEKAVTVKVFISDFRDYEMKEKGELADVTHNENMFLSFWCPKKFVWTDRCSSNVERKVIPAWLLISRLEELSK